MWRRPPCCRTGSSRAASRTGVPAGDRDDRGDRQALTTAAVVVAANAASHSRRWGAPVMSVIAYSTVSSTTATSAKLARLKTSFSMRCRPPIRNAALRADQDRGHVVEGRQEEEPDDGRELAQEKECVSRRKWTWTTLSSAVAKPAASNGQGSPRRDDGSASRPAGSRRSGPRGQQASPRRSDPCRWRQRLASCERARDRNQGRGQAARHRLWTVSFIVASVSHPPEPGRRARARSIGKRIRHL